MSNWKHAYGWSGHIITPNDEMDSDPRHNVVAVPRETFKRIWRDYADEKLDERIAVRVLGVTCEGPVRYLACGSCFSEGFTHYGTTFTEAEIRADDMPLAYSPDAEYLRAMKGVYGLDMPPCRLMVGCSSEH